MAHPAYRKDLRILLTGSFNYLARHLARQFITAGAQVYAVTKHAPEELVAEPSFVLLDLDLAQPLPDYLPGFDIVCHFWPDDLTSSMNTSQSMSAGVKNITGLGPGSKVALVVGVRVANQVLEKLPHASNIKIFLTGDIYGPDFPYNEAAAENDLTALIHQATGSSQIILEDEGREPLYPTYISDAVFALEKFLTEADTKKTRLIISQESLNVLTAAYEIQDQLAQIWAKNIELYFSENKPNLKSFTQAQIRLTDLGYEPKVDLADGLKKVFEHLKYEQQTIGHKKADHAIALPNVKSSHLQHKTNVHKKTRTLKIPKFRLPARNRKLLILIAVILFIFLAKIIYDLSAGAASLRAAVAYQLKFDFASSQKQSQTASRHLDSASGEINLILSPVSILFGAQTAKVKTTLNSAGFLADALNYFSQGTQSLVKNLQSITQTNSKVPINFENTSTQLEKAYFLASIASAQAASSNSYRLPGLGDIGKKASSLALTTSRLLQLNNLLPQITGQTGTKTYLLLLQDNWQLRPGGGFIKTYGTLQFENGRLKSINFDDVNKIDANLKEKIEPPSQYAQKLGTKQLFLRDSNISSDFAKNSTVAHDLFFKETGILTDGVISLDAVFLKNLVKITGPVAINGQKISADNLDNLYIDPNSNPNSLTEFADRLFKDLTNPQANSQIPYIELFEKLSTQFSQKHILADITGGIISPYIKIHNLNNILPPPDFDPANNRTETRDYLSLSEANLGGNEANYFMERKIDYQVDVGPSDNLVSKLKITYTNKSQNPNRPQGTYVNFLKVYTPKNSYLIDYQQDAVAKIDTVKAETEGSLKAFSLLVEVPPKSTVTSTFTYSIGKTLNLQKVSAYQLYVQKQPGTLNDPFTFSLNLPEGIQIDSVNGDSNDHGKQNYKTETNLEVDRQFAVGLVSK